MKYAALNKVMGGLQVVLVVTLGLLAAGCFLGGLPLVGLALVVLSATMASL